LGVGSKEVEKAVKSQHFIGVDLAWSSHNPTGLAALRWDGVAAMLVEPLPEDPVYCDDEIVAYIGQIAARGDVVVAIDAPLTVPNRTGRRPGETELNTVFARFHAGAHPANRKRLASYNGGTVRGEVLVERLAALGIRHNAVIIPRKPTRQVFEAYPHPAMVVLFQLDRVLKYKAKPAIPHVQRLEAFRQYQRHLRNLRQNIPPAVLSAELLAEVHLTKRGQALKIYEDQLDAVFCAYLALYYWWWGTERCRIFGDVERGYIVAPIDERVTKATKK
jgi:predicted RNase H-like nuclease